MNCAINVNMEYLFENFLGSWGMQRRGSFQTRKGRCSTLNCCMSFSSNGGRLRRDAVARQAAGRHHQKANSLTQFYHVSRQDRR
ncbi:hypothetical protein EKH55_3603 [Sinorhizobium alkalisoli]|nr:hypothetical protein EKH55_3603 [Sinorhizobium alkalisoli]